MHHEPDQRPAAPPASARRASSAPHKWSLTRFSAVLDALQSAQTTYPQQLRDKPAYTPLPPDNGNHAQFIDLARPHKLQEIRAVNPCNCDTVTLRHRAVFLTPLAPLTPPTPLLRAVNLCNCDPVILPIHPHLRCAPARSADAWTASPRCIAL